MASFVPNSPRDGSTDFRKIADSFLLGEGLPFSHVLSANRIERIFKKHRGLFGVKGYYTTAIMVWSFLSQVLRDGKEASCQAAVDRVIAYYELQGLDSPTEDTGDYCRARANLSVAALREISCEVAEELQEAADPKWLWKKKHHAKLVDGFTFTMPDTPRNRAKYPQQKAQKPGVGFPIARATVILSLATACVMNLAMAPYAGKETGENALLRSMLGSLASDDIAVMDRYYCSFMMIALLLNQGTQVCARKHHLRHSDFRRGKRLGRYDHLIVWTRPNRPEWMDEAMYALIPETLILREIRYNIIQPGRRTKTIDVITTLVDADEYSKEDIAELYGYRWNAELDVRSLKSNMNLSHVRCKSPEMVHREVWTTMLGYNLIRTTAAGAAILHDKQPRQISFTATCQAVLSAWVQLPIQLITAAVVHRYVLVMLKGIAGCEVANRPGRLEPRVLKRRRHGYKLMMKSRNELRRELRKHCT